MDKDNFSEKEKALFINYERILANYGKVAKFVPRMQLYREAGETVFLSGDRAMRIIGKMQKAGYSPTDLDISEFDKLRNPDKVFDNIR